MGEKAKSYKEGKTSSGPAFVPSSVARNGTLRDRERGREERETGCVAFAIYLCARAPELSVGRKKTVPLPLVLAICF